MIVSPGRNYIFVHIPKTGGTALAAALEARAKRDDILIGDTPKALRRRRRLSGLSTRGRLWKHATLADIEGLLPPQQVTGMLVFTLVRNPWDRLVSYFHWARHQSFDHPAVALSKELEFNEFLRHPTISQSIRASPYGHYLTGSDGCERPGLFVRLEHLTEDIAPLEAHLGFALSPLARTNVSDRPRDYRSLYDDALAGHVASICATDIARFGYRF